MKNLTSEQKKLLIEISFLEQFFEILIRPLGTLNDKAITINNILKDKIKELERTLD